MQPSTRIDAAFGERREIVDPASIQKSREPDILSERQSLGVGGRIWRWMFGDGEQEKIRREVDEIAEKSSRLWEKNSQTIQEISLLFDQHVQSSLSCEEAREKAGSLESSKREAESRVRNIDEQIRVEEGARPKRFEIFRDEVVAKKKEENSSLDYVLRNIVGELKAISAEHIDTNRLCAGFASESLRLRQNNADSESAIRDARFRLSALESSYSEQLEKLVRFEKTLGELLAQRYRLAEEEQALLCSLSQKVASSTEI